MSATASVAIDKSMHSRVSRWGTGPSIGSRSCLFYKYPILGCEKLFKFLIKQNEEWRLTLCTRRTDAIQRAIKASCQVDLLTAWSALTKPANLYQVKSSTKK
jgi:hypothetical protein